MNGGKWRKEEDGWEGNGAKYGMDNVTPMTRNVLF